MNVTVIGAGLAGSEAAWQLAQRGIDVTLREMKPEKKTPAHETEYFAELCCSNSLRSDQLENAVGLLKEELRRLGSLILQCADATRVEAGGALAVDRHGFARMVTEQIRSHPHITVVPGEVTEIPEGEVVIASGPLTSDALAERLQSLLGADTALHFYDAAAPLVTAESVDMDKAWFGSRYDRGTADYVNCPMTEEEYDAFWKELTTAQEAPVHGFEDKMVFEGCMPVEVMARRGHDTLCYGPLKPRGLKDPRTCGKENGPCTVQKKRPLRRAPARSRLRATGVGGSVQAPILACLRARYHLLQFLGLPSRGGWCGDRRGGHRIEVLLFSLPLAWRLTGAGASPHDRRGSA